jgi:hypothetical protein
MDSYTRMHTGILRTHPKTLTEQMLPHESKPIKEKGLTTLHNSKMGLPWTVQQALMVFGFQMFDEISLSRFYQSTPAVRKAAGQGKT